MNELHAGGSQSRQVQLAPAAFQVVEGRNLQVGIRAAEVQGQVGPHKARPAGNKQMPESHGAQSVDEK
jgi:hypothetical protein